MAKDQTISAGRTIGLGFLGLLGACVAAGYAYRRKTMAKSRAKFHERYG